ncbi:hypothetical protein D3C80_1437430 [compost metagenome]
MFNERLNADNRVVTPIVGFTQLPEVQTGGKQRTVHARRKLLAARIKRVHTRGFWRRLDDTRIRVRFHQTHQTRQTLTRHHGVSIQHHHIAILVAPATAEVIDVTAFALNATATTTVENLPFALHFRDKFHPRFLLGNADIGVVAVAQDVNVKMRRVAGRLYRLPGRTQTRKYAVNVFVTNRHNQRSAVLWV